MGVKAAWRISRIWCECVWKTEVYVQIIIPHDCWTLLRLLAFSGRFRRITVDNHETSEDTNFVCTCIWDQQSVNTLKPNSDEHSRPGANSSPSSFQGEGDLGRRLPVSEIYPHGLVQFLKIPVFRSQSVGCSFFHMVLQPAKLLHPKLYHPRSDFSNII